MLLDKTLVGCGVTDKVLRTVTNVLENEITVEVRAADNKLHFFCGNWSDGFRSACVRKYIEYWVKVLDELWEWGTVWSVLSVV